MVQEMLFCSLMLFNIPPLAKIESFKIQIVVKSQLCGILIYISCYTDYVYCYLFEMASYLI